MLTTQENNKSPRRCVAKWPYHIANVNKYVNNCCMNYSITYYSEAVQAGVLSLPPALLARYFSLTDRMETYGANLGEPHTKAFGGGLFELRLKGAEGIARVFYCTLVVSADCYAAQFCKEDRQDPATRTAGC